METILVLSDIHGGVSYAKAALRKHPECKTVIFLGDGTRHLDVLEKLASDKVFFSVMGNCDTFLDGVSEPEALLNIAGHRIFICHGHTRMAKYGHGALLNVAKQRNADIVLFGHTHAVCEEYDAESGVYLFNPGSIGNPHDGRNTYGILTLDEKNVLFSVGTIEI